MDGAENDRTARDTARISRRAAMRRFGTGGLAASALVALGGGSDIGAAAASQNQACTCGATTDPSIPCTCEPPEPILSPATLETLPETTPETSGRLRLLTDYDRGPWLDVGGQWVAIRGHVFDVRAFGAVGDGQADDWAAFHAAIEAMTSSLAVDSTASFGHTLLVPPGTYRLAQALVINRAIRLTGTGAGGRLADAVLRFDPGITGIIVAAAEPELTGDPGRRGDGTIIERLRIESGQTGGSDQQVQGQTSQVAEGGPAQTTHGVWLRTRAAVLHCAISGFAGDGIHVEGPAEPDPAATAGWHVEACEVTDCGGHGLGVIAGSGGVATLVVAAENGGRGISDASERGNTYVQCQAVENDQGAFTSTGSTNRSLFLGCDSESGQPRSLFAQATLVVGGSHGAGFEGGNAWTATGSRMLLQAQEPGIGEQVLPTVPTLHLIGSGTQSQPHILVEGTGDARLAELDTAGNLFLGPVEPDATPTEGGGTVPSPLLLNLIHPESGRAGIRWVVPGESPGFVAQARAFVETPGPDAPQALAGARLTFQTATVAGAEIDTLTLREGRIGVGTTAPDPVALLDLSSTNQGFLPPRLTSEQRDAIASPPEGLTIYNLTTHRPNFFDGSAWQEVAITQADEEEVTGG